MTTSRFGRRFIYMVVDNYLHQPSPWYTLHRIDPSQLFGYSTVSPAPVERARLPEPAMSFGNLSSDMEFTLLGRNKDKIVGVDHTGRGVIYDDDLHAVAPLHSTMAPKPWPTVSVVVDSVDHEDEGSVYVIDTTPQVDRSVEALVYEPAQYDSDDQIESWGRWPAWRSLPPPPYVFDPGYGDDPGSGEITCYAADTSLEGDGALIWVSTAGRGTYWLDTVTGAWTKEGDWALPFRGRVVPVPNLRLWVGFSAKDSGHICATDMFVALDDDRPPTADEVWEGFTTPEGSREVKSYLVHLRDGQFCVAKLYEKLQRWQRSCGCWTNSEEEAFAMLTGVEVVRGDHTGKWHRMVKHRTFRYSLGRDFHQCVL